MALPLLPIAMAGMSGLGGLMQAFGKKKPAQNTQLQRFTPGQVGDMNQMRQMGMQGLQDPTAGFQPIADEAQNNFMSNTLPQMAEQFAGLGGMNSSGYKGMMTGAGEGLNRQLAADKAQYGLQNRNSLMNLMQMGMQPQFENIYRPESAGRMQSFGASLSGQGLGGLMSMMGGQYLGEQKAKNTSSAISDWQKMIEATQGGNTGTGYSPVSYQNGLAYSGGR